MLLFILIHFLLDGNQPEDEMLESSLQILTCFADLLRDVGTESILPSDTSRMSPDEQVVHRFIEEVGKSARQQNRRGGGGLAAPRRVGRRRKEEVGGAGEQRGEQPPLVLEERQEERVCAGGGGRRAGHHERRAEG